MLSKFNNKKHRRLTASVSESAAEMSAETEVTLPSINATHSNKAVNRLCFLLLNYNNGVIQKGR